MNSAGNVRWRTRLARPVVALEIDPLGRFLIYGHGTGEIVRLDLFGGKPGRPSSGVEPRPAGASGQSAGAGGQPAGAGGRSTRGASGSVRTPDWAVPVVETDQQAETAVITVVDEPPTIAVFTSPHRLQLFNNAGQKLAQGPDMSGVGRILRSAPGWLAAATDRQILLCDLKRNSLRRIDVSLVQLTHLAIKPDDFGLALVQERDRIGRLTPAGRWVWKHELRPGVEDLAIGPDGFTAITTDGGQLQVFDPAGESTVGFSFDPSDPPLLIEAPAGSPAEVIWLSMARRAQWLRGHALRGEVVWERPTPWEGWSLFRLGPLALITAADGRALTSDGFGTFHFGLGQGAANDDSNAVFCLDPDGEPTRISRHGVHLIGATLDGRVRWRCVVDQPMGPLAAGTCGTALLLGKSLAWFKSESIGS